MSAFAGMNLGLGALPLLSTARTRSISPENPTGEKGKGGMAIPNPEDPDLLTNAGIAWMSLGRFEPALRALRRVVALEPDDAQAWANLGAVYGSTGRWSEARESYVKALTLNPANPDARAGLRTLDAQVPSRDPTAD